MCAVAVVHAGCMDYPYLWFTWDPKSKQDKVKVTNFEKIAKNLNFKILLDLLHATHLLNLFDKMYKYEMDLTRTVGAAERTPDAGRTDGVKQLRCVWGIMIYLLTRLPDPLASIRSPTYVVNSHTENL